MAGLWSQGVVSLFGTLLLHAVRRSTLALAFVLLPACSELAQPSGVMPSGAEPPYVSIVASHFRSAFADRFSLAEFEISGLRWVHSIKGWSWLACVHFQDRGHRRTYALFIQGEAVVDARYAVATDSCETQTYTQFDVMSGVLGRPTAPVQSPLY
jgi:hypothetical protein